MNRERLTIFLTIRRSASILFFCPGGRGSVTRQSPVFVVSALLPFLPFVLARTFLAAVGAFQVARVGYLSSQQANPW